MESFSMWSFVTGFFLPGSSVGKESACITGDLAMQGL